MEALGDECEVMGWRLCWTELPFVFRPSSLSLIPKSHLTVTFDEQNVISLRHLFKVETIGASCRQN
jgi:hypothetical protein